MRDLKDGESVEMPGSGAKPYTLKNVGGVYSCPAWRNQSLPIEKRTCKHLRKLRGDEAEEARVGSDLPERPKQPKDETAAPPLLLAESWDFITDPIGWWLSEKLDGVRALWDGKQFWSRLGIFSMPRTGLLRDCRTLPWTASSGWAARSFSAQSASFAARTRATTGRKSAT
jgi:DNA ligase 1